MISRNNYVIGEHSILGIQDKILVVFFVKEYFVAHNLYWLIPLIKRTPQLRKNNFRTYTSSPYLCPNEIVKVISRTHQSKIESPCKFFPLLEKFMENTKNNG